MNTSPTGPRRAVVLALLVALSLPLFAGVAAADERAGGTVVVEEGETVTGGLQATAGTVVVRGTVEGNLEAFAGTVEIAESGTVTGNLEGAAGNVRIAGTVEGNVEAAGGSFVVAQSGTVGGDVQVGAGSFSLDGTVDGTVQVGAGSISLGESAAVGGDFLYDGELTRAEGATIDGELRQDSSLGFSTVPRLSWAAGWVLTLYGMLLTLIVGALLLLAFPGTSAAIAESTITSPLRTLGVGFLALLAGPLLFVLLLLSIVGIPLAFLWLFVFGLLLLLSFVWGEYAVGAALLSLVNYANRWLALVVGVVVVFLVGRVPIVGGIVEFLVLLLGLGGLALTTVYWGRRRRRRDTSEPMRTGTDER
ncbi:bactofilin family protein [Halobacterium wangiae]|uniref:bactofilin family protein n=1 Tax=Halobacterium wangiae TaxID=2902623 RepID=UPI001E596042|nr:polymer-forming cytoskeletal protein [Halobacterium wangiae]